MKIRDRIRAHPNSERSPKTCLRLKWHRGSESVYCHTMFSSDRIGGTATNQNDKPRTEELAALSAFSWCVYKSQLSCFMFNSHIHKMPLEEYVDLARQVDKTLVLRSLGLATVFLLALQVRKALITRQKVFVISTSSR